MKNSKTLIRSVFRVSSNETEAIEGRVNESGENLHFVDSIDDHEIHQLWTKFDKLKDGVIHMQEFVGTHRGIDQLVQSLKDKQEKGGLTSAPRRLFQTVQTSIQKAWQLEHRIYLVFVLWVSMGIVWGMIHKQWDFITATHFAISALATGGLTAPQVDQVTGILDAQPAIFCGIFCLLGIPLFALTLGHFAKVLVDGQAKALEASALTRPLSQHEYDLARHLTSTRNTYSPLPPGQHSPLHLSDFMVLQLLRQGKLTVEMVEVLKQNFDLLDKDHSGAVTLEEAIAPRK